MQPKTGQIVARFVLPMALTLATGCGSSEKPVATPAATANQPIPTPDKAVFQFLEAVRTGNDATAAGMLTKLAREKTAEMQLVVAPPGSATAKFTVGEVEMIGDDGAHVASTWTDIVDDGKPHTDTIVWILRREPDAWRIAGMGTKLFDDQPPLLLNFEDPEDMMKKQRLAEEEMNRRSQLANKPPQAAAQPMQAQLPANSGAPQRK